MTLQEKLSEPSYLSPREAAAIMGVCVETVLNNLRSGRLKGFKMPPGKLWRIDPKDLPRPA